MALAGTARGGVVVDAITARLLPARFDVRAEGPVLRVSEERALGIEGRSLLGRPAPWVGRERELATLQALYEDCAAEPRAVAVLLLGPAGSGKSRLVHELLRRGLGGETPPTVWIGRGDPLHARTPYAPVADAVRRGLGIAGNDEPGAAAALSRAVGRLVGAEEEPRVTAVIARLVGVEHPSAAELDAAWRDPRRAAERIRGACVDLLAAVCREAPLVFVLEDAEWADPMTLALVDAALRELAGSPLCVVAVARPQLSADHPNLWSGRSVHVVPIEGLGRRACRALAKEVLGPAVGEHLVATLVERSGGNPFFLEELLRAHGQTGGAPASETAVAIVQARLEAMEVDARRVLRAASVFGERFSADGVRALLGSDAERVDVAAWLSVLTEREVVGAGGAPRSPRGVEHAFRHALVRDAAYAMLTADDAALGHRLAAEWLESMRESHATLAAHFEAGRSPERARGCWMLAAEEAFATSDFDDTCASVARALALGVEGEARGRQLALLIGVSWWRGERIDAALGDEALSLLVEGSPRWCNCVVELAVDSWRAADRARLRSFASRLLDAVASIPHGDRGDEDVVAAVLRLGVLGELAAEPDLGGRAWELVGGREDLSPANLGRLHRLESERARREGDLGEALRAARSARRVARELGDSRAALVESSYVVRVLSEVGAFAEVEVEVGAAVAECTSLGLEALGAAFLLYRGVARVATGAVLEGRAEIESAVRTFARVGDPRMLATARLHLAIAHLRGGDAASAAREALAAAAGEPLGASDRAWAEAVLADARRAEGDVDAALAHASSAARIAQAQAGIEAEVGTAALLALARAQLAGARAEAARSTLGDAQRWLTTRAARIHEPDLRRSFLHAVPVHAEILGLAARLSGEAPSDGRS